MAKSIRGRRRLASRQYRPTPYPMHHKQGVSKDLGAQKCSKVLVKKDWEDATCSVCMEYPHNAVLVLCSSHDKGCLPYMCGTSCRYSNCLDQYKKAYTKVQPLHGPDDNLLVNVVSAWPVEKCEVAQLACPLCRGQVKGWTVVEPARAFLNAKKRACMQEKCSFVGTYKDLRRHVRTEHPSARPREVNPADEQKWRRLERERERERDDVISTITSSMPGAMVFGDYVIEGSHYDFESEDEDGFDANGPNRRDRFEMGNDSNFVNVFLLLHAFGPGGNAGSYRTVRSHGRDSSNALDEGNVVHNATSIGAGINSSDQDSNSDEDDGGAGGGNTGMSLVDRIRHCIRRRERVLLGRSEGRRQLREANGAR